MILRRCHILAIICFSFLSNKISSHSSEEILDDRLPTEYENVNFFMNKEERSQVEFTIRMKNGKTYDIIAKITNDYSPNIKALSERLDDQSIIKARKCNFNGQVLNYANSKVRLIGCGFYTGRIEVDGNIYQLEYNRQPDEAHASYKIRTVYPRHHKNFCGVCRTEELNRLSNDKVKPLGYTPSDLDPYRTQNIDNIIYSVDVAVITDVLAYFNIGNQNRIRIVEVLSELFNFMNNIYRIENLYIRPRFITIMTNVNYFHINSNVLENKRGNLLEMVRSYRNSNSNTFSKVGTVILYSQISFIEAVWGLAFVGVAYSGSGASFCTDFTSDNQYNNDCFSHELGHNFNLPHDYDEPHTENYQCLYNFCLMNGVRESNIYGHCGYSTVSRYYISTAYVRPDGRFNMDILDGYDILIPSCGNLIVEEGEECDCGMSDKCERMGWSKFCDAETCTFKNKKNHCVHGKCCDTDKNIFVTSGTLCRETADPECDLNEYCTGSDEECPINLFMMDGKLCNENQGICVNGICTDINSVNNFIIEAYNDVSCTKHGVLLNNGNCICNKHFICPECIPYTLSSEINSVEFGSNCKTKYELYELNTAYSIIIFLNILPIILTISFLAITAITVMLFI